MKPVAAVTALVLLAGCSTIHRHLFGGTTGRSGVVTVAPATGAVGTAFSLTAAGFRPGENMTFEIDIPHHQRFVGPSHQVGPDGRITSAYTPQASDPAGTYVVKAVGDRGTHATGHVVVTSGP